MCCKNIVRQQRLRYVRIDAITKPNVLDRMAQALSTVSLLQQISQRGNKINNNNNNPTKHPDQDQRIIIVMIMIFYPAAGRRRMCSMLCLTLALFLVMVLLPTHANAGHVRMDLPTEIVLKAGFIPGNTFGGFQMDLLERLEQFAYEDQVNLTFEVTPIQDLYTSNLPLIGPECHEGESVTINEITYNCSDFDMIVGDFWPNPDRYNLVDFTPPWLPTSISALKYTDKHKYPDLDVTTLTEATRKGAGVCTFRDSYAPLVLERMFPGINVVLCHGNDEDSEGGCIDKLKAEECFLLVSDELVLRYMQADDPYLEMTGEQVERQWLAWPVRRSLDPSVAFLLNKWMYAAVNNQTINELYFEYFAKKLCPIGTAGKNCELFCDPAHGSSDAAGACVCESPRWTGDDCSIEVPEDSNAIPPSLAAIVYSMLASNVLVIFVCGVWLYWHRQTPQVRVSQPYFLVLVLLGCLISSLTIIAFVAQDDTNGHNPDRACMVMPWLYSVGFSITFGTLFAKIRRVYKLFTAPPSSSNSVTGMGGSSRRNAVPIKDTVLCIGAVLLVDVIILVSWSVIDPLTWHREVIREDQFGDPLESQGYCTCDNWEIFASVIALFHFGLLAVACYMCFVARNIPSKYSEHKFVTIAMISNFQIFLVGLPILVIVVEDAGGTFFVRSVIVWMNDLAVVTLIFGNLMYSVHYPVKQQTSMTSEEFLEPERIESEADAPQDASNSTPPPSSGHDDQIMGLARGEKPMRAPTAHTRPLLGVSSLSTPSAAFSQRSSVKSVSFSENVSISEIPFNGYEDQNDDAVDRFAATKGENAPLKPIRSLIDNVYIAQSQSAETRRLSLDSSPNIPKRPALGTSEVEDLAAISTAGSTPPQPNGKSMRRASSDSIPGIPKRVAPGASGLEVDDDGVESISSSRPHHIQRGSSFDSSNPSAPDISESETINKSPTGSIHSTTSRRSRLKRRGYSFDSSPSIPKRGVSEVEDLDGLLSSDSNDSATGGKHHSIDYTDSSRRIRMDLVDSILSSLEEMSGAGS